MTEVTVLAVIRSKGLFQINPLAYRSDKTMKLLKRMVKDRVLVKQRVSARRVNYFIADSARGTGGAG